MSLRFFALCFLVSSFLIGEELRSDKRILICGICRDVEKYIENTIENIEQLGSHFANYQVLLYENNSKDQTSFLLSEWARSNSRVSFTSETLSEENQPFHRTERLADARNKVLEMAREPKFCEYEYLLWVDLDFLSPWPIDEIIKTTQSPIEWGAVSVNGTFRNGLYRDRLAFRDTNYPFGPELLGNVFWKDLESSWFAFPQEGNWIPVYSAFGGLTLYKTKSILPFSYGGLANKDIEDFCGKIISKTSRASKYMKMYLNIIRCPRLLIKNKVPLVLNNQSYSTISCCEHLVLYAAMAKKGFDKIFINPTMVLEYPPEFD